MHFVSVYIKLKNKKYVLFMSSFIYSLMINSDSIFSTWNYWDLFILTRLHWWLSWWRICLQRRRPWLESWVWKICWRRDRLPAPVFLGFPCGSASKESVSNAGDPGSNPGLWRSPGEGKGYLLQYSSLNINLFYLYLTYINI